MSEITITFLIISLSILFFIIVITGLSKNQIRVANKLIKSLDFTQYRKVNIKFQQTTSSKGKITTGMYTSCYLFYNTSTLIIAPKEKSYFNIIFSKLPIIITIKTQNIFKPYRTILPENIKFSNAKLLLVEYTKQKFLTVNYSLSIKFEENENTDKIKELIQKLKL